MYKYFYQAIKKSNDVNMKNYNKVNYGKMKYRF